MMPKSLFLALTLGLLAMLPGCREQPPPSPPPAKTVAAKSAAVQVTTARLHAWPEVVRVQGSLMGDEQAVVGVKVAGRVREVLVDLGTPVRQGQILCLLDTEDFDLRVEQAEAQLMQARASLGLDPEEPDNKLDRQKSPPVRQEKALVEEARFNLERVQKLMNQNASFVTLEELQQRQAALNVAEARLAASLNGVDEKIALLRVRRAELALAKRVQTDAVTLAPFDGVVQQRHVAPGVFVSVGDSIVTLVRTDPLRFRVGVPERQATQVRVGQQVTIDIEGQEQPIVVQVSRISPALEMSSRALMIECDVPNGDGKLRTGLFAEAEVVVDPQAQALSVPVASVSEFAGVEKVWIVENGKAEERRIATGRRTGELIEIINGVSAGDSVIADADTGRAGEVAIAPGRNEPQPHVGGGE